MKEKNSKIQIVRAISVIAVVIIHTCPPDEWQVFIRPFVNFSVAAFLFLSGYLTKTENKNWGSFYKKRITRVLIPYVIWTLIYTCAGFVFNGVDLKRLVINLLTTNANGTLYYVFVYIQFVLLTPLLGKLAKSKFSWVGWLVTPLCMVIKYYWLINNIEPNKIINNIWTVSCVGWFTFYYMGLLLGNGILKKKYNIKGLFAAYFLSVIVQMLEGGLWLHLGDGNCGTQAKFSSYLTSAIAILIIHWYITNDNMRGDNKFLITVGNYSFGIYLSHIMVINVLNKIPYYSYVPVIINSAIVFAITLVGVIVGRKILGKKISGWLGLC